MKKISYSLLLCLALFFVNCDNDPCDEGYSEVDGVCLPDYVVGVELNLIDGDTYYHVKHGVIVFKNGSWINQSGHRIALAN